MKKGPLPTPNYLQRVQPITFKTYKKYRKNILLVLAVILTTSVYAQYPFATKSKGTSTLPAKTSVAVTKIDSSINSPETNKITLPTSASRTAEERPRLAVQLLGDDKGTPLKALDGLVAVFDESFKTSIGMEDSYKLSNQNECIAINRGGTSLSIEGRPIISSSDTLPLRIWKFRNKIYAVKLEPFNFPPELTAFVRDAYLNQETPVDLQTGKTVPFNISTDSGSFAPNRFMIVLKSAKTLPVTIANITAYPKEKGVHVEWIAQSENNVAHYEVERSANGQQFNRASVIIAKGNNAGSQLYNWSDASPKEGNNFYRIKVINKEGTYKYTSIVRVNLGSKVDGVSIYPNPITNNTIGVQFSNMKKGSYTLELYNNLGREVFTNVIGHNGVATGYSISTNTKTNAGIYTVRISNKETTSVKGVIFK